MTDHHEHRPGELPPAYSPRVGGMPIEWAAKIVRELTLQNVLILTILMLVGIPSYFAYRFMADSAFRHEFMQTSAIINAQVPCLVIRGNLSGQDRYSIGSSYKIEDRMEFLISIRSPGVLGDKEVADLCDKARGEAQFMLRAIADQAQQQLRDSRKKNP